MPEGFFERRRNHDIFNMRQEGHTLATVAQRYGISRERVRQICARFHRQAARDRYLRLSDGSKIGMLPLTTRLHNAFQREDFLQMDVVEFCETVTRRNLDLVPNLGPKSIQDLIQILEERGHDVSNLRSPRDGENHNASEHG